MSKKRERRRAGREKRRLGVAPSPQLVPSRVVSIEGPVEEDSMRLSEWQPCARCGLRCCTAGWVSCEVW